MGLGAILLDELEDELLAAELWELAMALLELLALDEKLLV